MEQLDESLTDKELSSTKDEGYCSRTGDSFFEEADNTLSYKQSKKNLCEELVSFTFTCYINMLS